MSGTFAMVADMLGLGAVVEEISSPDFQAKTAAFVAAVMDTNARVIRCEAMLAALLEAHSDLLPAPGTADPASAAAVLVHFGRNGAGGAAASGAAADHGTGAALPAPRLLGNEPAG